MRAPHARSEASVGSPTYKSLAQESRDGRVILYLTTGSNGAVTSILVFGLDEQAGESDISHQSPASGTRIELRPGFSAMAQRTRS
jgi:hypothetical protein